jgi:nucleoid-associated protein YgaU
MGREQHILLAILGLLAGAFVGVLSMKLLSPRPPAGTVPIIEGELAVIAPVSGDPPTLSIAGEDRPDVRLASATNEPLPASAVADSAEPLPLDPLVAHDALPMEPPPAPAASFRTPDPPAAWPTVKNDFVPTGTDVEAVAASHQLPIALPVAQHEVTRHVAAAGDSWWSLAERLYGDGRWYRAPFAWNRAINPRVSLVPGTPLELPPLSKLAVAWPGLAPEDDRTGASAGLR